LAPSDGHRRAIKSKGKAHPRTGHEDQEGEWRYCITFSLTSALVGGGWSMPRPGRLTPGKDPISIVQKAGWAPGPVWTDAENPTGFGSRTVKPVASRYTE
jgi:hypothetical protein